MTIYVKYEPIHSCIWTRRESVGLRYDPGRAFASVSWIPPSISWVSFKCKCLHVSPCVCPQESHEAYVLIPHRDCEQLPHAHTTTRTHC